MFATRIISRAIRAPVSRSFARSISFKPQQSFLKSTWKSSSVYRQPRLAAPFSTSFHAMEKQGTVDEELALKLNSELSLETVMKDEELEEVSSLHKEFLDNSPFKINDTLGQEEVELVRKFGDETIRVVFSTADLRSMTDDEAFNDDQLFDEEEDEGTANAPQSGGAQSKVAKDQGNVPVADEAAEEEELSDDEEESGFPARVNVVIEKPNQGALQIEAIAQDGMIVIENVFYHKNAALATAATAEADWERRGTYAGPPFGNLDEELQVLLERYLDERGINTSLALFIPEYIDYKEQKEYVNWLENVKNFVEA